MNLDKPILITGASGKTGQRVVAAVARKGAKVRAFVRRPETTDALMKLGAAEVAIGDLTDAESLRRAMAGAGQVIHICPPMHPKEDVIAATMIGLAQEAAVDRFMLYSVLHPLLADVPHHDRKLDAERALIGSGLPFTILQPSRYMQHLLPIWKEVREAGLHSMPFSVDMRFSLTDLDDLAEATALIATQSGHDGATYELAGPVALSQNDVAAILTRLLGKPIRAEKKSEDVVRKAALAVNMPEARIVNMLKMNAHYDAHGLIGNSNILRWILGRAPNTFEIFVQRELLKGD